MNKYKPIDCGFHSEFELAIMHHKRLKVSWKKPNENTRIQNIKPTNLVVRHHEEFLIFEDEKGLSSEIRLDYILDILV